jgi:N-acetylglucosaminyl-diphospho-decaprenol L-rhamnosyltransferase
MLKLDVVIVNWNAGNQLRDCLQSIKVACSESVYQVSKCVVVDNASTDGSTDSLEGISLPLILIKNTENKGFGSASNQGAAVGNSEYILFLNPDVRLYKDSLTTSLLFLENPKNNQIGILGIQLVNGKGVIHRNANRFPTSGSLFYEMLGMDRLCPTSFPPRIMTDWDHRENKYVDHVEGSFFLVRRSVFEELSGFDERFFLYFEDVDFSFQAKQTGWKSFYLADSQAFHRGGGTTDRIKARRLFYWFKGRLQFVAKHFGRLAAWWILIASFSVEFLARVCINIIKLKWQYLYETLQAYGMYIKAINNLLREMYGRN